MESYEFEVGTDVSIILEYAHSLYSGNKSSYYHRVTNEKNATKYDLIYHLPYGNTCIEFENHKLNFNYVQEQFIVGLSQRTAKHEELHVTIRAESRKVAMGLFEKFVLMAAEFAKKSTSGTISRIVYKPKDGWTNLSRINQRSIDTVYLNEKQKTEIMSDIIGFQTDKSEYIKYGIPHSRKYLLEGPPGTGKTSLITAIASKLNKHIAMISFNNELDDAGLMKAISSAGDEYIFVFEDIDAIFDNERSRGVTLSGLLNTLDGFGRKEGMIIFMTTNHFERLSKIFVRPGRIDIIVHFNDSTESQVKEMFDKFFPTQQDKFKALYSCIAKKSVSMALMQKFFFDNRKCDDILSKTDQLRDLVILHTEKNVNLYT